MFGAIGLSHSRHMMLAVLVSVLRRVSVVVFLVGLAFLFTIPAHP